MTKLIGLLRLVDVPLGYFGIKGEVMSVSGTLFSFARLKGSYSKSLALSHDEDFSESEYNSPNHNILYDWRTSFTMSVSLRVYEDAFFINLCFIG